MVEPKAKKYKTKKEKEKDTIMEELVMATQTMVGGELHDEETQSLRDLVEEAAQPTPRKPKKKKIGKDKVA